MKIAFTSCMSTRCLKQQPVWSQIADRQPDALVLLGDSVYIDVPGQAPEGDDAFCRHLHGLYRDQLLVPGFASLLQTLRGPGKLGVHAIWDDHDFLWNDADSVEALRSPNIGRALYSANLFRCWTRALADGSPWPEVNSPAVQDGYASPAREADYRRLQPGYRPVRLVDAAGTTVWLHLTDGRSWRTGKQILGPAQRLAIEQQMAQAGPSAVHLLASGSALARGGSSAWDDRPDELRWLRRLASRHRVLVLSGDIHRNDNPPPRPPDTAPGWGPRSLWEATSSGAGVNFNPFGQPAPGHDGLLAYTGRFGLLEIDQTGVQVRFFAHGAPDPSLKPAGYRIPASFSGTPLPA